METLKTNIQAQVEDHLLGIFDRLGIKAQISSTLQDGVLRIEAQTDHDELLLSRGADPLLALQHLLRIVFKQLLSDEAVSLVLNIGDFHSRQQLALKKEANLAVQHAIESGEPQPLRPMSSYERRIVHMVVAEHSRVESTSEGEGGSRRIVIRPKKD